MDGTDILHAQIVVGLGKHRSRLRSQQLLHCPLTAHSKRQPLTGKGADSLVVGLTVQANSRGPQRLHIAALAAEADHICPARRQQGYRPPGEVLCRGHRPHRGQLQHQIHPAPQGQAGAGPLVRDGAVGLLHPVAAHHRHHGAVLPQGRPGLGDLVRMPGVEGVIFRCDAGNFHGQFPSCGNFLSKLGNVGLFFWNKRIKMVWN